MKVENARLLAFEVICDVIDKGAYSNLLLPQRLSKTSLEPRDRAFATELVYGTLRLQGRLDHYLSQLSHRPLSELDFQLLVVLRLGVFQLKELSMPPHAAVNETTELAKRVVGKSSASFVNAILREVGRSALELPTETSMEAIAIRTSHPEWIVRALSESIADPMRIENLLHSHNRPTHPTLNALPGRCTAEELLAMGASKIESSQNAFEFKGNPGEIPAVREHRAIVQDLGSQIVVEQFHRVSLSRGKGTTLRWLDACSGPGGKAAYLDALIPEEELVANEISAPRSKLVANVVRRARVTTSDARFIKDSLGEFDRILIDAPCTGLGALRRRPEVRWRRTPADLASLQNLQREILNSAVAALNPGGIIGYSTCSPHLAETSLQIRRFLAEHKNFRRIELSSSHTNKDGDLQLWTDRDGTDSMFLSLLERVS